MSTTDRGAKTSRKGDVAAPSDPRETNSIVFEWPLRGLKHMFDSSKLDTKSKVIKSAPFGNGRWTVLFYAQSGDEQFCSLYLNAEPLASERLHPMVAFAPSIGESRSREASQSASAKLKNDNGLEEKWERKGSFKFTFNIQTLDDRTTLGTKEAHDHAFSHKTSNWGWAKFAKRDHVYYKNPEVVRDDGFLITVTITSNAEKPRAAESLSYAMPPVLVQAMGSLLDDPEHSDVVFLLHPSRRRLNSGHPEVRKVYAIRKILAARSEYFRLMFDGGFQEAEAEDTSEDEEAQPVSIRTSRIDNTPAQVNRPHHAANRPSDNALYGASARQYDDTDMDDAISRDEGYEVQDPFIEDSDEDFDEDEEYSNAPTSRQAHTDPRQQDLSDSGHNSPDEGLGTMAYTPEQTDDEVDQRTRRAPASADHVANRMSDTGTQSELIGNARMTPSSASPEVTDGARFASAGHSPAPPTAVESSTDARNKRERVPTNEAIASSTLRQVPPPSLPTYDTWTKPHGNREPDRRKRRKVNVLDSAYLTFKALLFFLYTDTVVFAPLTSSFLPADITAVNDCGNTSTSSGMEAEVMRRGGDPTGNIAEEMAKAHRKRRALIENYRERNPDKPTPCSAKAMYRLADKLDICDLKRRAQDHIQQSLTVNNIVWEVFSGFNTQYPEIRRMETDFLLKHWPQVKRSSAMKSIFLRSSAHPGLAEVWPHLLEYLEYRQPDVDDTEDQQSY